MQTEEQVAAIMSLVQIGTVPVMSRALWVVAEQKVADHMADGPAAVADIAPKVDLHPDVLLRLLRALASEGIFAETDEPGTFVNTASSEALISDDAFGGRDAVRWMTGQFAWSVLDGVMHSAKTGKPSVDAEYGMPLWEHLESNPDDAMQFNRMMTLMYAGEPEAVTAAYDFSSMEVVADLGGGIGTLLGTILAANPHLKGILVDRQDVVDDAAGKLEKLGVLDRCERVGMDFREEIPAGADAYVLSHIVHDWEPVALNGMLKRCAKEMGPESRLLIVEMVVAEGNVPDPGKRFDLAMLLYAGGRERTESEYRSLLDEAGLELTQVIPTHSGSRIIEARVA